MQQQPVRCRTARKMTSNDHALGTVAMRQFLLAASLIIVIAPACAGTPERGNEDLKASCSADAAQFCSDKDPHSPEMDACFKANMSHLSEPCRRAIRSYKRRGGIR